MRSHAYAEMCEDMRIFAYAHNFRVCNFENAIICGKYAICGFCNICVRMCDRMFSYNRYPYNCASVQRALLAPEILNESFLKCRYFTALYLHIYSPAMRSRQFNNQLYSAEALKVSKALLTFLLVVSTGQTFKSRLKCGWISQIVGLSCCSGPRPGKGASNIA